MLNREIYTPNFIRLIFSNLFFWLSTNLLVPTIPVHFHGLGYPASSIGFIVGFFALGALLFRIPSGRWVDKYGGTKVLGTGIVIASFSLFLLLFSTSLDVLLIARFLHGASITGFSAAALSFITTALTFLLFPKNIKLPSFSKDSDPISILSVAKNPGVWIPSICQFGSNFAYGALFAFVPLLFESARASGLVEYYIAYAVAVILTRAFIGKILTFFPSIRLLGFLLYGFGVTLAFTLLPPSPISGILIGLLIGFTYGIAFPSLIPIVSNHTRLAERGTAFGVFTISVDLGAAVGSIFLGSLIDLFGLHWVFAGAAIFLFVLGFIYRSFLQKKLADEPEVHETFITSE